MLITSSTQLNLSMAFPPQRLCTKDPNIWCCNPSFDDPLYENLQLGQLSVNFNGHKVSLGTSIHYLLYTGHSEDHGKDGQREKTSYSHSRKGVVVEVEDEYTMEKFYNAKSNCSYL